jgi:hypothetical protein
MPELLSTVPGSKFTLKMFPGVDDGMNEDFLDQMIANANTGNPEHIRKLGQAINGRIHFYMMGPSATSWHMIADRHGAIKETCYLEEVTASQSVSLWEIAATGGDVESLYLAGTAHCAGFGRVVDKEYGLSLVQKAADAGHEKAQDFLAHPEKHDPIRPMAENIEVRAMREDGTWQEVKGPALREPGEAPRIR